MGRRKSSIRTIIYKLDGFRFRRCFDIYNHRWQIELLFKQLKQNFPLKYFYGESVNAIQSQIWVTLIANLLLTVVRKQINVIGHSPIWLQ